MAAIVLNKMSPNPSFCPSCVNARTSKNSLSRSSMRFSHISISQLSNIFPSHPPSSAQSAFPRCFTYCTYLYGFMTTFLEDTKGQAPMPCFHTIKIEASWDGVSTYLLPWSTKAHTMKISATNIHNTTILPSVTDLRQLELSYLEFWAVDDVFRLIASLPPTLKKLTVRGIRIYKSWPTLYLTVGLGIDLEHVETESAEDLSLLLRDNCLISLKSLRVASVSQARPHDPEDLIQRTPHLIDLL